MVLSRTVDPVRMRTGPRGAQPEDTDGKEAQAARRMAAGTQAGRAAGTHAGQAAGTHAGQAAGRAAGDDHRRGLGDRAEPGSAAVWSWLGGGHCRHRRGRAEGNREDAAGAGAGPGARRPGRGGPAPLRGRGARVAGLAAGLPAAGRGLQQSGRRGRLVRAPRWPGRRRVAAADQLRRGGQRHPRLPAHPGRAGRGSHRQHRERVRPAGHALPERLLRVEVRGARLHRRAAPGTARHRGPRGDRPPGRRPDQHRSQRAGQEGPDRPGTHPRADGGRVRGAPADHAGPGGRDNLPRGRPRQGPHPGRPRRLRLRPPGPGRPHALLRRDGAAGEAAPGGLAMTEPEMIEHRDVLIVGAGLSGIGAAHHLQAAFPARTYAILEARDAIGGTWDLFRYPGVRSDSDMFTLGYRFRPWTEAKAIADGPSILGYVRATAAEAGIEKHIRFGHRVRRASWFGEQARWTVEAELPGGETATLTCGFLLMCSGYYRYDQGYQAELEGIGNFGGQMVHPQFWPRDLDYAGRRVVVIGSGATAVTLVPALAETAEHV